MSGKTIIAAGLDVGSTQTRLLVCALEKGRLRLLGCGVVPSQGWVKGKIFHFITSQGDHMQVPVTEVERIYPSSRQSHVTDPQSPPVK